MGSGDSKRRKRRRPLPKVGTPRDVEWSQHAKQREVLEDVGIRTSGGGASRGLAWILIAVALVAIAGFVLYLTLR
jgi:hypothetical protein